MYTHNLLQPITIIKNDALTFLRENSTAVVATSFNDEPRASTVYYFVDDDFNFYFVTIRNTAKYMNIHLNPKAAIVVGTGPEHISVQAHGIAVPVLDETERKRILHEFSELRAHEHIKLWPIEEMHNFKDRNKEVFKVMPQALHYMNLDSVLHPQSLSDEFRQIIP